MNSECRSKDITIIANCFPKAHSPEVGSFLRHSDFLVGHSTFELIRLESTLTRTPYALDRFRFILIVFFVSLWCVPSLAEDWPLFRGNPQLTGVASSALPDKLETLWTSKIGRTESTAAISGNMAYLGSTDGSLYALELETGKVKWKFQASDEIKSSPSVVQDTVYFGDEKGGFYAISTATGEKRWTFQADAGITSSVNFHGDKLLFGSYDNHLYCLSLKDGALLWKLETESYVHATPTIVAETAVVAGCDGVLRVADLQTGKEVQTIKLGGYVGASSAYYKGKVYLGTFTNKVVAVDLTNGKLVWEYENTKQRFPYYSSPAVTEEVMIIGGRDRAVHALDSQTGKEIWEFNAGAKVDSSPVIAGNRVVIGTTSGMLYLLDLATGKQVWQFETGSQILSSPAVANQKLVIGTQDGIVYCFGGKR